MIYDVESVAASFRLRDEVRHYGDRLTHRTVKDFQKIIYEYYAAHKRDFPWRNTDDPYHILVSEVMLQQTQADRVVHKYVQFIEKFPTVHSLAKAPIKDVLEAWQGLGYNRRGLMLHRLAGKVVDEYDGTIPPEPERLITLPGIGKATSASIAVFAYNRPEVFIETNIRTVFIHFFFHGKEEVADSLILPLVERTIDRSQPYHWYSALMDYGTMIKRLYPNPGRRSRHYQKQGRFEGSRRQMRGKILKLLLGKRKLTVKQIVNETEAEADHVSSVLGDLVREGIVKKTGRFYIV